MGGGGKGKGKGKGKRPMFKKEFKFQVTLKQKWTDFWDEEDKILKRAFLVGHPTVRYTFRDQPYEYDFKKLTQKNLNTGKCRDIRPPHGARMPAAPLLPNGPMVVISVKPGQAGQTIEIPDPNNPGQKVPVAVPPKAQPGQKLAVPVPDKGESPAKVVEKQKGMSTGAKVAVGAGVAGLAVGGVILGDHLSDGAVTDWATDVAAPAVAGAAADVGDWAAGAAADVGDWASGAGADLGDFAGDAADWTGDAFGDVGAWAGGAAADVGDWLGDAAEDVGDFVFDLF